MAQQYGALCDKRAYLAVLGSLMQNPMLISDVDRPLDKTDFGVEKFYSIIYVSIYNLYQQGVEKIDEYAVDSFLSNYTEQYKIFQDNDGLKWVSDAIAMAQLDNYDYYYHRVKKFALLRYYESNGLDTRCLFDLSKLDSAEEQKKFNDMTEQEMVDFVSMKFVATPECEYCSNQSIQSGLAGEGLLDLIDEFLEVPDYGFPMTSLAANTLCRGLRKGTLTLRAATSGAGKTRNFLMDACNLAVPYVYDLKKKEFVYTGHCTPTLYYGVEQSLKEYKSIILACVSGVNEAHIIKGQYEKGELERVRQAAQYIADSPLELIHCDDYTIREVENTVKQYINKKGIEVFIFDYIQTTGRLTNEEVKNSSIRLQEYQVLIEFSRRLKALAERCQIAILTGAQLKSDTKDMKYKDESCMSGAKALINKIDCGIIYSKPRPAEKTKIAKITEHILGCPEINLLQWYFKIRSGELTSIIVASHIDLGTLRIEDVFVMDYDFNLIELDFTKIEEVKKVVQEQSREIKGSSDIEEDYSEEEYDEEEHEVKKNNFNW